MYPFRWNDWNIEHIAEHGVVPIEVEFVVDTAEAPYPQRLGGGKFLIVGRTVEGRLLQVIYVLDPPGVSFVIHARPLNDREKRRLRRRKR